MAGAARESKSFVSASTELLALLCPRRRARFERWNHSTRESSHSRINNVRHRTEREGGRERDLTADRFLERARARLDTQRERTDSSTSGKIGSGPLLPMTGNIRGSRGIQNGQRHPAPSSPPTTPTSDCSGSRYTARVFTRCPKSQKPLSLITLLLVSSLSALVCFLPPFFSFLSRCARVSVHTGNGAHACKIPG